MKFQKENDERSESSGEHIHDFSRLVQSQITDAEGFRMLSFTETCFFCGRSRDGKMSDDDVVVNSAEDKLDMILPFYRRITKGPEVSKEETKE